MKSIPVGIVLAVMCSLSACDKVPAGTSSTAISSSVAAPAPEAFLARLYSHYNGDATNTSFSPTGDQASQWFDKEMVALMAEDSRLANGEVGALDGDPVCGCQDFGKLSADIKIEKISAAAARANVIVTETDAAFSAEARKPRIFTYDLVKEGDDWRIHDIATKDMPSLHDWLVKSNAEASSL